METKELTTHQRGVILRGICGGAALKDKSPQISENNTVITCAEAFGLKPSFGYDGHTRITFTPKE